MKYLITLCLVAAMFTACNQGSSRFSSTGPEIDEIKAHIAHYETGDWEAWLGHYADTAKFYHNTTEASSPAEAQEQMSSILENTSSYKFQDENRFYERIIDDKGDTWVYFWGNWEGTLAANNQNIIIPVHVAFMMDGGKIVEEHGFYNMAEITLAMMAIEEAMQADTLVTE